MKVISAQRNRKHEIFISICYKLQKKLKELKMPAFQRM